MDTSYELWNVESGNIIGSFATDREALAVVQDLLDAFGHSYARELSLGRRVGDHPATILGEGLQLVDMMEEHPLKADQRLTAAPHTS